MERKGRNEQGAELTKLGHSKDGKTNKKLIGVGMVTSDENVPFFGETYEGNENDQRCF